MNTQWWKSKKFLSSLLAGLVIVAGPRLGISPDVARDAGLMILGGAGIEGVLDLAAIVLGRSKP